MSRDGVPGLGVPSGKQTVCDIEHGHRNSEFSHEKWVDFPVRYVNVYQRVPHVVKLHPWPCQEPISWRCLPYMCGLCFRPKFQGISPQNMARNMVLTYLHFRSLKFPLTSWTNWILMILDHEGSQSPQETTPKHCPVSVLPLFLERNIFSCKYVLFVYLFSYSVHVVHIIYS